MTDVDNGRVRIYKSEVAKHGGEDIWQSGKGAETYMRSLGERRRSDLLERLDDYTRSFDRQIEKEFEGGV